jgi:phage shock protein A
MSSTFLDGGASSQALIVKGRTQREQVQRGGALVVEANLFGRIVRIVKSYANAVVSSAEDPEKLLDQTVIEMGDDLAKMRQASAQVLASQKQLEQRYKQAQSNADDWLRRAKLALQKGQEELAREALKKKKDYEDNANALKAQLDAQKGVVDKLISNTRLLESKISEAKSKKDTLKARAQSAKTSQKVQEMLGNINTSSAMAAFEKMEEKVMALEAESDAVAQLGTDDLSAKFALLESSDVDDDLDKLKREMSGIGSQTRAALPGGQSTSGKGQSTPGKTSVKDLEIEAELNELRKKASDL